MPVLNTYISNNMQISVPIKEFSTNNILFCNRSENTVINGGGFYRTMYCDKDITMLGIHITFDVDITLDDTNKLKLDVREALTRISPSVLDVVTRFANDIHHKWESIYGPKNMSYPATPHSVEPAILKALHNLRNSMPTSSTTIKMPFVFKCAGVYDTENDAGVSFRLNSVTHL